MLFPTGGQLRRQSEEDRQSGSHIRPWPVRFPISPPPRHLAARTGQQQASLSLEITTTTTFRCLGQTRCVWVYLLARSTWANMALQQKWTDWVFCLVRARERKFQARDFTGLQCGASRCLDCKQRGSID